TFSGRPIVGYSWIVLAAVGTGFLSFGLWVHHMFATGLPQISLAFFSAASEAVAIPTAVQSFVFLATMLAGRVILSTPMLFPAASPPAVQLFVCSATMLAGPVILSTPMLFALGGIAIFGMGGFTGVVVALAPFDWQAHDTYFIVAHLHYVLVGGMLFPVFAGLYYYYPLIDGKHMSDKVGRFAFWMMFCGFNITFFPMHLVGLRGMPRRVHTYPGDVGWDWFNLVATMGAVVLGIGMFAVVVDVTLHRRSKPRGEQNPWKA